jgi:hypothetical protein
LPLGDLEGKNLSETPLAKGKIKIIAGSPRPPVRMWQPSIDKPGEKVIGSF